ncbi:hypothetical protein BX600DRAFT_153379 [Xylariales sp. PMI_506]|nr:hypothetical protein BX600DRAFT_153379 [Xylariales sp. PMI_506]
MLRTLGISSLLVIGVALLISFLNSSEQRTDQVQYLPGKNNTVLFLTTEAPGLCNVHLATAYALLENHQQVSVHYASFPKLEKRVGAIARLANKGPRRASGIIFYPLIGPAYLESLNTQGRVQETIVHPPGVKGVDSLCSAIQQYVSPWAAEDYYGIYSIITNLIDEIDPAVVVLDTGLGPAIDATREKQRRHAFIVPNILADLLPAVQPKYTLFWKYPALGSGHPFPVPWNLLLVNIYLNYRMVRSLSFLPDVQKKKEFLKKRGLKNPIDFMGLYRSEVPWVTQTLPGAHIPLDVIPQNVWLTGPINLAGVEADSEHNNELRQWLRRNPTVLIALGSGFQYSMPQAKAMTEAITRILGNVPNVQFLWKMDKLADFDGGFLEDAIGTSSDRLRVYRWLDVEPASLLHSGDIIASIHHGGSGSYHDAISGGVPQVILPQWVDLYNFAQLVEDLRIGLWGCRQTSPDWTADCLEEAMLSILDSGPQSLSRFANAAAFGRRAQNSPGRNVAAGIVAGLAASRM